MAEKTDTIKSRKEGREAMAGIILKEAEKQITKQMGART